MMEIVVVDREETLARLIRCEASVRFFGDPVTAYAFIAKTKPTLVFVGFALLKDDAPRYISYLNETAPETPIILTADRLDDDNVLECLAAGARGYLAAGDAERFIDKLIAVVLNGEAWISRRLVAKLLQRLQNSRREATLSG